MLSIQATRRLGRHLGALPVLSRIGLAVMAAAGGGDVIVHLTGAAHGGHGGAVVGAMPVGSGVVPNYVAGITAPQYGMPITGTPIGLPGPPHIPLGGPAGLQQHKMVNHTKMHIPGPTPKVNVHVKQRPGLSYPAPASNVFIRETTMHPALPFHQPHHDKFKLGVAERLNPDGTIPQSNNYFIQAPFEFNRWTLDTKVNWNATPKLNVFGRYSHLDFWTFNETVYGPILQGPPIAGGSSFIAVANRTPAVVSYRLRATVEVTSFETLSPLANVGFNGDRSAFCQQLNAQAANNTFCPDTNIADPANDVIDQDPQFLHFVEASSLKPGEQVTVDSRDDVADRVSLRYPDGRTTTVGTRAAAKILVAPA